MRAGVDGSRIKSPRVSMMAYNTVFEDEPTFADLGDSTKKTSMSSDQFAHNQASFTEGLFSTANNPVACMFHVGFKAASIAAFLFLNAILREEILTFIIVVLFAAFDFWTVKNVTGRILVNLRWWSEIDEWGNEQWLYESEES